MTATCPECGKEFVILYPNKWAYKRNGQYFCTWKCLRKTDNEEGEKPMQKMDTKTRNNEAVHIALSGGDPLRFLEECGCSNPAGLWYTIKQKVKEEMPETYAKLPKHIVRKDAVKKEEPAKAEPEKKNVKAEPDKIAIVTDPENPGKPKLLNYRVLKLETHLCRYIKKEDGDLVIMQKDDNYGIRMCAEELYQLIVELPAVMEFMGVK